MSTSRSAKIHVAIYARSARPKRYERDESFLDALRRVRSTGQKSLHDAAKRVADSLGMNPSRTRDALHDANGIAFPGVAQAIYRSPDPDTTRYAAAWYGLLTNSPGLAVFHVGDGDDSVYKFSMKGSGDEVIRHLDDSGISQRILLPTKSGFDVLVLDPGRKSRKAVVDHARKHGLKVQESVGTSEFIGDEDRAKAREAYRNIVNEYENK